MPSFPCNDLTVSESFGESKSSFLGAGFAGVAEPGPQHRAVSVPVLRTAGRTHRAHTENFTSKHNLNPISWDVPRRKGLTPPPSHPGAPNPINSPSLGGETGPREKDWVHFGTYFK